MHAWRRFVGCVGAVRPWIGKKMGGFSAAYHVRKMPKHCAEADSMGGELRQWLTPACSLKARAQSEPQVP
jgi:hypothetical protein